MTMLNPKSLLKVLPAVLLSFMPVVGMSEVARSQSLLPQQVNQNKEIDRLIQQLKSPDPKVRSHAAYTLGLIGQPAKASIPSLIKLLDDPKAGVRHSAIWSIGNIGVSLESITPSIIALLTDPISSRVRLVATQTLGRLEPSETLVIMLKLQLNDSDLLVRQSAARALGEMGQLGRSAIPLLISTLRKDPSFTVRAAAAEALGKLRGSSQQTVPALIKGLKDEYYNVRYKSAIALGNLGESTKSAIPDLIVFLKKRGENSLSIELSPPDDYDESFMILNILPPDPDPFVEPAIFALGKIGKPAIPALLSMLQEPNRESQILAIQALGEMKESAVSTAPLLVPFLKEQNYEAVKTLGSMGKSVVPLMVSIFQQETIDPFPGPIDITKPNQQAINQQGNQPTPQDRQREYGRISMEKITQESNAAAVIAKVAASDLNVIRPLMLHQDARVREGAAESLSKVPELNVALTSEVLSMLTMLLKDHHPSVRSQAAYLLGTMGEPAKAAIPNLIALLKDEDSKVRSNAAEALKKLGYQP
jgi:HEAT repeat protein